MTKNFENKTFIFLFVLVLFISLFFVLNFDRGVEFTDESYIILYSLYPDKIVGRLTNFGFLGNVLLNISNSNLFYFRILGFIILFLASILACFGVKSFAETRNKHLFDSNIILLITATVGTLCYYRNWIITPSYNMYNIIGALLFLSGICLLNKNYNIFKNLKFYLLISFGFIICFISKPSTSIFLSIFFIFWNYLYYKKQLIINTFVVSLITLSIFLLYILYSFQDFKFFVNDLYLGYDLIKTFDPRYNIFQLLIFSIKVILRDLIIFWYFYIFQILINLVLRKNKNFKILAFILPLIILIISNNLNIFLFSLILNFLIFNNKLIEKENFFILFIIALIFFISFGTNTNIVKHVQHSAILYFILIYYLLSTSDIGKKIKNNFLVLFLFFHLLINLYSNIFKPMRYDENILKQIYPINLPKLNHSIYVDDFTKRYVEKISTIKKKIDNRNNIKYLIDYTGRRPSLNLLFGYSFITRPWWSGGYIGSDDYIKKILKLSKKKDILNSIIVLEKDSKMRKLNVDNFMSIDLDFDNNFELLDTISLKSNVSSRKYDLEIWVPK